MVSNIDNGDYYDDDVFVCFYCSCSCVPVCARLTGCLPVSLGQELSSAKPQQCGWGILHPCGRAGLGHAGGAHRVLLQVQSRGQENEGGID